MVRSSFAQVTLVVTKVAVVCVAIFLVRYHFRSVIRFPFFLALAKCLWVVDQNVGSAASPFT